MVSDFVMSCNVTVEGMTLWLLAKGRKEREVTEFKYLGID